MACRLDDQCFQNRFWFCYILFGLCSILCEGSIPCGSQRQECEGRTLLSVFCGDRTEIGASCNAVHLSGEPLVHVAEVVTEVEEVKESCGVTLLYSSHICLSSRHERLGQGDTQAHTHTPPF